MNKKTFSLIGAVLMATFTLAQAAEKIAAVPVQSKEVELTYRADGVVEAVRQSTVSAQISGRVKEVHFEIGDHVNKGQVILRIDEREASQALAGSQAQSQQSQAALQNAKLNYERSQQLFEQKYISQAALDKALADYKVAQAQASASEAGAQQSALAHAYTTVLAPYSGVVSARMVELGEMVTVGKPLMTGFDPSQMRVLVNVPQYKLAEIGKTPQVLIELPSLNRWLKPAAVTVQPAADVRTHSTSVRVDLKSNEAGIYPGMFVRSHFVIGKVQKMVVPNSAVLRRSEVVAVYVVDAKNVPHLRQIRLGEPTANGEVEVLSGLTVGEQVAIDPVRASMAGKLDGVK